MRLDAELDQCCAIAVGQDQITIVDMLASLLNNTLARHVYFFLDLVELLKELIGKLVSLAPRGLVRPGIRQRRSRSFYLYSLARRSSLSNIFFTSSKHSVGACKLRCAK